ncbi:MAG: cytochrome c biogenesis protein CcsA, partial [Planctomycetaceae bacterium]|nr:cytochrome c biogenesis protein CcsA [Planctomycetaceae bacterium]
FGDFEAKLPELQAQMSETSKKSKTQWTVEERKRAELLTKVSQYRDVRSWFGSLEPTIREDFPQLFAEDQSRIQRASLVLDMVRRLGMFAEESKQFRVPLVIPQHIGEAEGSITRFEKLERNWESFPVATGFQVLDEALGVTPAPAVAKFEAILDGWKEQDAKTFNAAVTDYRGLLEAATPEEMAVGTTVVSLKKSDFEGYFDRMGAFNLISFAYVFTLLLTLAGWGASGAGASAWGRLLQRSALWTIVGLLVMHTLAIAGRIYISGRPPVTNLYSSAIFIGWAAVLMGAIFERIFRMGVGNAVASIAGFATLRIAHALMGDGDTLAVVEAVLDTQFWLATHVVCITLGYAATYVAGIFGLMYVLMGSRIGLPVLGGLAVVGGVIFAVSGGTAGMAIGALTVLAGLASLGVGGLLLSRGDLLFTSDAKKTLSRMTYGTLCGAAFLSFVGTVLGGLWADDSWGRFWGWDPKENGALIIVVWNALILHARWDRMIADRGMAALAVLGNVVTSWSWFGVNELGIGLHSYGFTEGRLFWLMAFCLSQLVIVAVALLPRSMWWSERRLIAEN